MFHNNEVIKKIPNYDPIYTASSLGFVYKNGVKFDGGYRLGYLRVPIIFGNKRKYVSVHRIIAITFLENPSEYKEVNHKNGIKDDNRVENLEWCNRSMNCQHAYDNNLHTREFGEDNPNNKLTEKDVLEIYSTYETTKTIDVAKKFDINPSTVHSICHGKIWKHLNLKPKSKRFRINSDTIEKIKIDYSNNLSYREISIRYNVSESYVYAIINCGKRSQE